jgi:S-DNA-T family DNA segregation ATPase FtsK/SpoIIIE
MVSDFRLLNSDILEYYAVGMSNRSSKQSSGRSLANEVVAVLLVAAAVLLGVSLLTYDPRDPSWNSVGPRQTPSNLIGIVGAYIGDFFLQLFGLAAFCIPVLFVLIAVRIFFSDRAEIPVRKVVGAALLLLAISGFISLFPKFGFELLANIRSNGGAAGYVIEDQLAGLLNLLGAAIVLTVASVLTLMLTMEVSLANLFNRVQSAREERAVSNKGKPTMFQKLRSWLVERIAERRRQAELKRTARIAERAQLERERQAQAEAELRQVAKGRRRVEETDHRVEERRIEKEPVITRQVVTSAPPQPEAVVASAQAQSESPAGYAEEDARELKTGVAASARAPSSIRSEMAAVIRDRAARNEQAKSVKAQTPEVDVDPDVAEMTSTAWIDRTVPGEQTGPAAKTARQASPRRKEVIETASGTTYKLPTVGLLEPPIGHHEQAEEELRERAVILAEKCKEFSVTGHIHRINPGPVVTTFEFKPDPGIKYSRVVGLADDLCLALKAESIRIDRIPGKSTVGIEAPNAHREKIFLRDIVESPRFQQSESKLTVALGKTINGEEYIADLARMPHLLIAGATGAGKSVTLNAIICSILYKASPDEVKFIMVDPKRVELGLYEGIPHLLTPIVTDPKRAANALKWAVNEMESRYRELAKLGVRNIEQFNREVREMTHPTLSDENPEAPKMLPYIVIAIDELADLMMVARGEVETSIARLAQMARAVGIHLVLATQRPSVDIITGVIKANIPSRIAFRVSSKVDSRTIIDSNGAEALLGQGDMLFLPPGTARLIRVHGSFVNENEIKAITDHTRKQAQPDYNEEVTLSEQETQDADGFEGEQDDLYEDALIIVTDMGRASTSVLQRRLSIGYGRAAKILDMMERQGFIGPGEGSKPRKVLQAAYDFRERLEQKMEEREE